MYNCRKKRILRSLFKISFSLPPSKTLQFKLASESSHSTQCNLRLRGAPSVSFYSEVEASFDEKSRSRTEVKEFWHFYEARASPRLAFPRNLFEDPVRGVGTHVPRLLLWRLSYYRMSRRVQENHASTHAWPCVARTTSDGGSRG